MRHFLLVVLGSSFALCAQAKLELVVTVPVETNLTSASAPETLDTWLDMIAGAKDSSHSIDLEQFYISNKKGEPMEKVLKALRDAAKRGVPIRLIVDKTFLSREGGGTKELAGVEGIEVRTINYGKLGGGVQHAKFFIVNGSDAYLGSANFDWRALKHVHETGIRTDDPHVLASLRATFEQDWKRSTQQGKFRFPNRSAPRIRVPAATSATFTASPVGDIRRGTPSTIDSLLDLIGNAKTSVQVQTMDYSTGVYGKRGQTWTKLQDALKKAAQKISVQLLVDETKGDDESLTDLVSAGVEVKTVRLPEHSSGSIPFARLIHSKYALVDGKRFWIGTDNLSKGYFYESRGVGVVASDAQVAGQLEDLFTELWKSSYARSVH